MSDNEQLSVSEVIEDLERFACGEIRKVGILQNDGTECDSRPQIEKMLRSSKKPTAGDWSKQAHGILDHYCQAQLEHEHNKKGDVVVTSYKNDWTKKAANSLIRKMENAWSTMHENEEEESETKMTKAEKTDKGGKKNWKGKLIDQGKKAAKRTLVRKVARNLVDGGQHAVVAMLASSDPNFADPAFRDKVAALLTTDPGKAFIAAIASFAAEHVPGLPEDAREQLVEELQTQALDNVSMPIENMIKAGLPFLMGAMAPLLTGGAESPAAKFLTGEAMPVATPSQPGDSTPEE
jgi:hypothetical protein